MYKLAASEGSLRSLTRPGLPFSSSLGRVRRLAPARWRLQPCRSAVPAPGDNKSKTRNVTSFPYSGGNLTDGCQAGFVTVDNSSHQEFTVMNIEMEDYPGLLRIMTWVLNGMSVRVHHGVLETNNGMVKDTLYLTDFANRKLKDSSAASLAERLQDFLVYCSPQEGLAERQEWRCGSFLEVSNSAHPHFTKLVIRGEPSANKPGFLLELASAVTAVGASIQHGVIQGSDKGALERIAPPGYDFKSGRWFEFLLSDPKGNKLDVDRISSLVFTLGQMGGKGYMPLTAPNMESILKHH